MLLLLLLLLLSRASDEQLLYRRAGIITQLHSIGLQRVVMRQLL